MVREWVEASSFLCRFANKPTSRNGKPRPLLLEMLEDFTTLDGGRDCLFVGINGSDPANFLPLVANNGAL